MNYSDCTNQQLINEFNEIFIKSKVSSSNINRYIHNHYPNLYNEIERRTIKLNQYKTTKKYSSGKEKICDISIFERLYCLEHKLDDRPMCKVCGEKHVAGFSAPKREYAEYCSQKCQRVSPICIAKQLETKEKIYGKGNMTNKVKARQTRLDKYGSYNPKDFGEKLRATKLRRYGDERYINVEKIKETVERHKTENPNYYADREAKAKQTKISNGHDPNWNNREKFKTTLSEFTDERRESIKEKRRQTCMSRYGVDHVLKVDAVKAKAAETNLERHGVENGLLLNHSRNNMKKSIREKAWNTLITKNKDIFPLISKDVFISNFDITLKRDNITWKCKKCGHEFQHPWNNLGTLKCPKCFPQNYRGLQTEVADFVKSICPDNIIRNDCKSVLKNARQLDIYVEDLNAAVEFNGCFWHNSDKLIYGKTTPMMYHFDKSAECRSKGIQLVHIFEDEWLNSKKLCMSKLKKILCTSKMKKIDARRCDVLYSIDDDMKLKFLSKYTFYGDDGSSIQHGLLHNGHLVAMMTFAKPRNKSIYEWQILNYAEVNGWTIEDGFDVLLESFISKHHPKSICMHASADWCTDKTFSRSLDFKEAKKPRLFWTSDRCRIKSTAVSSKNAKQVLEKYDESKSFKDNMNDNGWYRIYDSGVLLFGKTFA